MTPKIDGAISMAELRAFYPALAAVAETGLKNPLDEDEAAWLDGPLFARWLYRNGLNPKTLLGDNVARRVRRWREGDAVNLAQADEILTALGHHISELPDTVWRERPFRLHGAPVPRTLRQVIVRKRLAGENVNALADEYGVSTSSIRKWVQEERGAVTGGLRDAA